MKYSINKIEILLYKQFINYYSVNQLTVVHYNNFTNFFQDFSIVINCNEHKSNMNVIKDNLIIKSEYKLHIKLNLNNFVSYKKLMFKVELGVKLGV